MRHFNLIVSLATNDELLPYSLSQCVITTELLTTHVLLKVV